jgi:hypothetical protein
MNWITQEKQTLAKVITKWEIDNWISQSQAGRLRHWLRNNNSLTLDVDFFRELKDASIDYVTYNGE